MCSLGEGSRREVDAEQSGSRQLPAAVAVEAMAAAAAAAAVTITAITTAAAVADAAHAAGAAQPPPSSGRCLVLLLLLLALAVELCHCLQTRAAPPGHAFFAYSRLSDRCSALLLCERNTPPHRGSDRGGTLLLLLLR